MWKGFVQDKVISMTGGGVRRKKHTGLVFSVLYLIEYAKKGLKCNHIVTFAAVSR